jgi:ParB-like chromosome segregation protein Spo0J
MAASIQEFGFKIPVLARSDGEVVDGHLRLKAARKLGLAKLPVILVDDLTDVQIKALRISVNQAADLASWSLPLLKAEIAQLSHAGFDMPLLGFPPYVEKCRQVAEHDYEGFVVQ